MIAKHIATAAVVTAVVLSGSDWAVAGGGDIAGGVIGAIIGGVIDNEANKRPEPKVVYRTVQPTSVRAANIETQTALNYFGFPAGTPDGVMGRDSQNEISMYKAKRATW